MKNTLILLGCAACLMLPVSADDTPLAKQMEEFNDAYKAMRRETDPQKGAALAREAQQSVAKTLGEIPDMLTKMPDGPDKAKAAAEYRKMIGQVYVALCEIEQAFLDGKTEAATEIITSLKDLKKSGHDKFMEE